MTSSFPPRGAARALFRAGGLFIPGKHDNQGEDAPEPLGTGLERPVPLAQGRPPAPHMYREFAFVDLCGFTTLVSDEGTHAAVTLLDSFRDMCRAVAAHRGVRVSKWLGDGVMLVGVTPGTTTAAAVELVARIGLGGHSLRGGVAIGDALLFDGADYVGRPVNLAARLCDLAEPGEVLVDTVAARAVPDWIERHGVRDVEVKGLGVVQGVVSLGASAELFDVTSE